MILWFIFESLLVLTPYCGWKFERPSVPKALEGKRYGALSSLAWGKKLLFQVEVEVFVLVMIEETMELAKMSFLYRVSGLRRSQKGRLIRMSPGRLAGEGFFWVHPTRRRLQVDLGHDGGTVCFMFCWTLQWQYSSGWPVVRYQEEQMDFWGIKIHSFGYEKRMSDSICLQKISFERKCWGHLSSWITIVVLVLVPQSKLLWECVLNHFISHLLTNTLLKNSRCSKMEGTKIGLITRNPIKITFVTQNHYGA